MQWNNLLTNHAFERKQVYNVVAHVLYQTLAEDWDVEKLSQAGTKSCCAI